MINNGNRQATFSGARLPFGNAKQYLTIGVSANALNYFGDIVPRDNILSTDIAYTRPGLRYFFFGPPGARFFGAGVLLVRTHFQQRFWYSRSAG